MLYALYVYLQDSETEVVEKIEQTGKQKKIGKIDSSRRQGSKSSNKRATRDSAMLPDVLAEVNSIRLQLTLPLLESLRPFGSLDDFVGTSSMSVRENDVHTSKRTSSIRFSSEIVHRLRDFHVESSSCDPVKISPESCNLPAVQNSGSDSSSLPLSQKSFNADNFTISLPIGPLRNLYPSLPTTSSSFASQSEDLSP